MTTIKEKRKIEKDLDKVWSCKIKERDNWSCAICGSKERLNSHHIIPREDRRTRHDLMNGITLCILHHKFSLNISPHKNAFVFFIWLMHNRREQFGYLSDKLANLDCLNKHSIIGEEVFL